MALPISWPFLSLHEEPIDIFRSQNKAVPSLETGVQSMKFQLRLKGRAGKCIKDIKHTYLNVSGNSFMPNATGT